MWLTLDAAFSVFQAGAAVAAGEVAATATATALLDSSARVSVTRGCPATATVARTGLATVAATAVATAVATVVATVVATAACTLETAAVQRGLGAVHGLGHSRSRAGRRAGPRGRRRRRRPKGTRTGLRRRGSRPFRRSPVAAAARPSSTTHRTDTRPASSVKRRHPEVNVEHTNTVRAAFDPYADCPVYTLFGVCRRTPYPVPCLSRSLSSTIYSVVYYWCITGVVWCGSKYSMVVSAVVCEVVSAAVSIEFSHVAVSRHVITPTPRKPPSEVVAGCYGKKKEEKRPMTPPQKTSPKPKTPGNGGRAVASRAEGSPVGTRCSRRRRFTAGWPGWYNRIKRSKQYKKKTAFYQWFGPPPVPQL